MTENTPDLYPELQQIVRDREKVTRLLIREKRRRGVEATKLVFLSMEAIATYYWCPKKALFESKRREVESFAAYLMDRISYSLQLGSIREVPKGERLLQVGNDLTFKDIEDLLKERTVENESDTPPPFLELRKKSGNDAIVLNPQLSQEQKQKYMKKAKENDLEVIKLATLHAFSRDVLLERLVAEPHPTIRWNFDWGNYVVVGVPTGLTNRFAYTFKSASSNFLDAIKPVALTLADLFGYFFHRQQKKVQIYLQEEERVENWRDNVSETRVERTLQRFKALDEGNTPKVSPPQQWKCRQCEYRVACTFQKH